MLEDKFNFMNFVNNFETQDFQIRYTLENGDEYRMGFLNNDMAFFNPNETIRRELSYEDVRLINTFVASTTLSHLQTGDNTTVTERSRGYQIEIYNDSKKVTVETNDYQNEFEILLTKLNLPYVSTTTK